MARISAEARSAAAYRAGGKVPPPPEHLDKPCKKIWRSITHSKPVDYFGPGSEPLLEAYVVTVVQHRFYQGMLKDDPANPDYLKAIATLNSSLAQLATKLRLALTSIDKRSGLLTEKGDAPADTGNVIKADVLFGGGNVKF